MLPLYKTIISFFGHRLKNVFQLRLCHSLVRQQFYSPGRNSYLPSYRHFFIICTLVLFVSITSCEKIIDVQLNEAEKKYIIEAVITDEPNSAKVLLSQTKNFDDNNSFNGVSGAQITIADSNGSPVMLTETGTGIYTTSALIGKPGHTYGLSVNVNGQAFTATSTMPKVIPFDSLHVSERTIFGDARKFATLQYVDPLGKGDAYRFIQYVNGKKEKTVFVRDDELSDGRNIERILFYFNDDSEDEDSTNLKSGDKLQVEMLCIDYPIYKYWYSLSESSTGDNQSASPANPVTNIQGGALGYFSAHNIQRKSLIVP